MAREPRRLFVGPGGESRRVEWSYPGMLSLQAMALYRRGGPGLYVMSEDHGVYRKSFAFWGEGKETLSFEMIHLVEDPSLARSSYVLPYSIVLGTFVGDWITIAERYREWGTRQLWAQESRLMRGLVPDWVLKTGLWVWNRGRSAFVLDPAAAMQEALGLPVSVLWHWWHAGPYDTSFPDYLPPREGTESFQRALQKAHERGLHVLVYLNQRLWCLSTPSWTKEGAERFAVRERDGRIRQEIYNVFDPKPCAAMDITTLFWRSKYAGLCETMVREYEVNGIYMDQAVSSLVCYDPGHGHPVGGGNYWMRGFRDLVAEIRRRFGEMRDRALAGEGAGEAWLSELDLFLTLQVSWERYAEPGQGWEVIPFFQAVYHPYGITFGNYSSLTIPPYDELWPTEYAPKEPLALLDRKYRRQFYLEQARSFVWGMQPMLANFLPAQLEEHPEEMEYSLRLARLRYRTLPYLLHGTFLRPPELDVPEIEVPISRLSIYAGRRGGQTEWLGRFPAVLAGAWRAPNGAIGIALASISDEPLSFVLRFDPLAYGLTRGGRIYRTDEKGRERFGTFGRGTTALSLTLPARGACVVEIEQGHR
ncbi:MAG: DUF6259 domain-containing protein [Blastocatellia bacterium]|nr:DUF6259 domain-containing protein [Blastocatellia bacterium]